MDLESAAFNNHSRAPLLLFLSGLKGIKAALVFIEACDIMDSRESTGLSPAAIVAIVCNTVLGFLILILFVILYKACKVPSHPEKPPVSAKGPKEQINEHRYLLAKP